MIEFTPQDLDFMRRRGSNPDSVQKQFAFFEKGFDFGRLGRASTPDDGILQLEED